MTLKEAVKEVISQNNSVRFHPEIFIFQTKAGEAEDLELKVSDLIRNPNTETEVVDAIRRYGDVLSIEELVVKDENGFGLPDDVLRESKNRTKRFIFEKKYKKELRE